MTWVDDTIRDFGLGMGMEDLSFNEEGLLCLAFETMGTLFLEYNREDITIYLVREYPPHETAIAGRALSLCHYRQGLPFVMNAALRGDNLLVFSALVPENDFSLPVLERAVDLLAEQHRKVMEETF